MTFRIGQRVVCIKRGQWTDRFNSSPGPDPQYGEIYEVTGFHLSSYLQLRGYEVRQGTSIAYDPIQFRPLAKKKTDISIFTQILNNPKQPVRKELAGEPF